MNSLLIYILIILIIIILVQFLNNKLALKNNGLRSKVANSYSIKSLMTEYEKYFYNIFVELEDELNIKIHPQVNLATIIKKETNNRYINELFRNIDFAIFDSNYEKLILLIEINDRTHNSKKRRNRDRKVDDILKNAGVKLIKFYSSYPNKKDYVKERIRKELNDVNVKKYNGFNDEAIEEDFKPKKSKDKVPDLPSFLEKR